MQSQTGIDDEKWRYCQEKSEFWMQGSRPTESPVGKRGDNAAQSRICATEPNVGEEGLQVRLQIMYADHHSNQHPKRCPLASTVHTYPIDAGVPVRHVQSRLGSRPPRPQTNQR